MDSYGEKNMKDTVYFGHFIRFKNFERDIDTSRSRQITQSREQFLEDYSCKFDAGGGGLSALLTTFEYDIPKNYSDSILVFFGIYVEEFSTDRNLYVGVEFDGQATDNKPVELYECGKWLDQKSVTFKIPDGAKKARITLELPPLYRASNSAYVDNLGIYFQNSYVEKPVLYTIFSDIDGGITAHNAENGQEIWTFETDYGFLTSKPVVVDNIVYFGDGVTKCNLYALYADTGEMKWKCTLEGSIDATPEVFDYEVYISTSKGFLYVIDMETGIEKEHYDILDLQTSRRARIYSNVLSDYVIYLTSDTGFYAFDLRTKKIISDFPLDYPVKGVPAVLNHIVYYADVRGTIYAMDIVNNQCLWRKCFDMPIHSSPHLCGNYLLVGCDNGSLYVLSLKSGAIQCECSIEGHSVRSYLVASDRLYVTFNNINAKIYAFRIKKEESKVSEEDICEQTGIEFKLHNQVNPFTFLWKYNITNGVERDPMIFGNSICFAASDGLCYCLDIEDGSVIWKDTITTPNFTSPVLAPLNKPLPSERRYDQYCYLMSHNSFAYFLNGWWLGNQEYDLTEQLDYGVRGLMLDIYKENINGVDQIVMYHGVSWSSYSWLFLEDAMREICIWLENNPKEIVTIQFENYVKDPKLVSNTFSNAGISDMIFYADRTNIGPYGQLWGPVLQDGWPSIDWMVCNNKRLVVFAEKGGDGLPYVWDYTVETKYGEDSLKGTCDERDESKEIKLSKNRSLYTVNNFPTIWYLNIPKCRTYKSINSFESLIARCETCKFNERFKDENWRLHLPNFLAVDFVTKGADGGPLRAVEEINKYWEKRLK